MWKIKYIKYDSFCSAKSVFKEGSNWPQMHLSKMQGKYINAVEEILAIGQREVFLIMHNL